jgi:hypothetical protein
MVDVFSTTRNDRFCAARDQRSGLGRDVQRGPDAVAQVHGLAVGGPGTHGVAFSIALGILDARFGGVAFSESIGGADAVRVLQRHALRRGVSPRRLAARLACWDRIRVRSARRIRLAPRRRVMAEVTR